MTGEAVAFGPDRCAGGARMFPTLAIDRILQHLREQTAHQVRVSDAPGWCKGKSIGFGIIPCMDDRGMFEGSLLDDSPDRDEVLVLADYCFRYQRELLTPSELVAEELVQGVERFQARPVGRPVENLRAETSAETWSMALGLFTGFADTDLNPGKLEELDVVSLRSAFRRRVGERLIASAGADEVARCSKCHRVLRSPLALQCFLCGYDWH